jgi:hypothetical protein
MGTWIKQCSLMMNLTRPFEIQNGMDFSLNHSKDILFGAHQVEDVILFIFKLSKLIIFIFGFFQSPELIKYVLNWASTKGTRG